MIDRFADASGDRQWVHVDVERAEREIPGGKTVAPAFIAPALPDGLAHQIPDYPSVNEPT